MIAADSEKPLAKGAALVTGGGRGIGRACCLALARAGFDVAVNFFSNEAAARKTAAKVEALGRKATLHQADLGEVDQAMGLVEQALEAHGRLDVLVNNAAMAPVTPITEITPQQWERVMAVNLEGAFFCAQKALVHMCAAGGGRIIFLSSQAGQAGGVFIGAHYVSSKAALLGLTKSFAKSGAAHGVLVNCVAPGQIDTPLTETFPPDKVSQLTGQIPLGRMGSADEVAQVVAFLASPAASYLTGTTIPVNGGMLMT